MKNFIVYCWNFIFDHEKSPLKNIPELSIRHMVFQLLGWMWALSFSIAIGSYTFLDISIIGHAVIIGAAAITVATYTSAAKRPELFMIFSRKK